MHSTLVKDRAASLQLEMVRGFELTYGNVRCLLNSYFQFCLGQN